jgi:integrase
LPPIVTTADLAARYRTTPKAIRNRVLRGSLPKPQKAADKRGPSTWTRETVLAWERGERRSEQAEPEVKITARPHPRDKHRMQVTFELPSLDGKRNRPRKTAPESVKDKAAAIAWGQSISKDVLREYMAPQKEDPKTDSKSPKPSKCMTLREFWAQHMENDYLTRLAPGTRRCYRGQWRDYIAPTLGDIPLDRIEREHVRAFRQKVQELPCRASRNVVLGKARTMLEYAVSLDLVDDDDLPIIRPDKGGKDSEETPCYSAEQVGKMVAAAGALEAEHLAILLLAVDACLRISEIAALRWTDVNLERASITIRHNLSDGQAWRPKHQRKGDKAKSIGASPRLVAALRALPRHGDLVLVRADGRMHTRATLMWLLKDVQVAAQVPIWSPHKLRHTGLTLLADGGAPLNLIRGQARHAHVSTTGRYIHETDDHADRAAAFLATLATDRPPRDTKKRNADCGPN